MSKVVAVQFPGTKLTALLEERGYQVIDLASAARTRTRVDALLYTSYHPDNMLSASHSTELADITWGGLDSTPDEFPAAVTLNIAGMRPDQVVDTLKSRLHHSHWNH